MAHPRRLALGALVVVATTLAAPNSAALNPDAPAQLRAALDDVRRERKLPALAGMIVSSAGLRESATGGVRRLGSDVPACADDLWPLGSDTKALTATLVGILVERGGLTFETTVGEVFPDLAEQLPARFRRATVAHLLAHRSGLPRDTDWREIGGSGTVAAQRREVVRRSGEVLQWAGPPGEAMLYSNWGYVVLGAMIERVGGASWEELMRREVFEPLGMRRAGFGPPGSPGRLDQPWPHRDGMPRAGNGPDEELPAVLGPAGLVHCPLEDWARFLAHELRGLRGEKTVLLARETFQRLHTPEFGGTYAGGWARLERSWAGGAAYTHAGSDGWHYAVAWLAPERDLAVAVALNTRDAAAADAAIGVLLKQALPPEAFRPASRPQPSAR